MPHIVLDCTPERKPVLWGHPYLNHGGPQTVRDAERTELEQYANPVFSVSPWRSRYCNSLGSSTPSPAATSCRLLTVPPGRGMPSRLRSS